MIAAGAFQACADLRSAAFFPKKESAEEDLPVCDDPATIDAALPGAGTADDPFIMPPAHLRLIGDTAAPRYALDKHYILGKDIDLIDNGSDPIGGSCGTSDAFTGSFDGKGYTISNINIGLLPTKAFIQKEKAYFPVLPGVQNTNFSYISEAQVCGLVDNAEFVTREDNSTGPYIVCSRAHLNAIDAAEPGLLTDSYALYQDINLGTAAEGGDGGGNFTPIASSFTGAFDGRGKEIMNLTISVNDDAGLFLELGTGGVIQDLGIENFKVTVTVGGLVSAGSLAALITGGRIVNCYAVDSDGKYRHIDACADFLYY